MQKKEVNKLTMKSVDHLETFATVYLICTMELENFEIMSQII